MRRDSGESYDGTDPLGFIAMNVDAERKAVEIRIRAERRAGELLAGTQRAKGGQPKKNSIQREMSSYAQAKKEAKISDSQAHRWQKLAGILAMNQELAVTLD